FTFLSLEEIEEYERLSGADVNRAKEVLAFEATRITHGEEAGRRAQQTARARFGGQGEDEGPSVVVDSPTRLSDLTVRAGLAESRNAAKRHIQAGAVRLGDRPETLDREVSLAELPALLSLGKRKIRLTSA